MIHNLRFHFIALQWNRIIALNQIRKGYSKFTNRIIIILVSTECPLGKMQSLTGFLPNLGL